MSKYRVMKDTVVFGGERDVLHFTHTRSGELTISITDSIAGGFYLCSLSRREMRVLKDALTVWLCDDIQEEWKEAKE